MLTPMPSSPTSGPSRGIALVTGGTAGIGLEIARQLAARGHDLVLVARDAARLEQTAADLGTTHGVTVETIVADLTDRADVDRVAERLADQQSPVDVLVNNAGFGLKGRFGDNDVEDEQAMLDVLVTAVMRLSHAALGAMSARGRGQVLIVSSVAASLPRGTYGAAKAWVSSFSAWAATEYAPAGVQVMLVLPGFVRTEFHERMDVGRDAAPTFLWLDVEPLVAAVLRDLDAGRTTSIPTLRYRAIVTGAKFVPRRLLQRAQSLGRR